VKIHDAFTSRCSQVRFVWTINHFSKNAGATFMGTYPGDAYVDYVGIDGYNWGSATHWGWQDFDTIFREPYCAVTQVTHSPSCLPRSPRASAAATRRPGSAPCMARWTSTQADEGGEETATGRTTPALPKPGGSRIKLRASRRRGAPCQARLSFTP